MEFSDSSTLNLKTVYLIALCSKPFIPKVSEKGKANTQLVQTSLSCWLTQLLPKFPIVVWTTPHWYHVVALNSLVGFHNLLEVPLCIPHPTPRIYKWEGQHQHIFGYMLDDLLCLFQISYWPSLTSFHAPNMIIRRNTNWMRTRPNLCLVLHDFGAPRSEIVGQFGVYSRSTWNQLYHVDFQFIYNRSNKLCTWRCFPSWPSQLLYATLVVKSIHSYISVEWLFSV